MKRMVRIVAIACLLGCIGSSVAYYNTSSLGYDNANIISYEDNELRVFDVYINFSDIYKTIKKSKDYLPDHFLTI